MSDKERTSPSPAPSNPIETADIWSDGTETASDRRIREFTLRELEKSKKTLPKERYEALVMAVGDILRTHYEREEQVHESVRTKIAEFKGEVDPKSVPGCLRNKFDPVMINGRETAEYLTAATSTPEKFEAFKKLLASDEELMAGFIRYWVLLGIPGEVSNYSNVKRIMAQNRGAEGVEKLNAFHKETVNSLGIFIDEDTLMTRGHVTTEKKNDGIADQIKTKPNFFTKDDKKFYEREGNKVSKDFAAIAGGASLSKFRNEEIADVFSYAYVHSNKKYVLAKESERVPDAISKIKARFAHDPAWLIAISEGWGDSAKTKPSIDRRLKVGDAQSIKKEFITTAKEAFKEATANIVGDFVKNQLGEGAKPEKIAKVAKKIRDAIEDTKAKPQSNYFADVGREIKNVLEDAGVKSLSSKDNLAFVRSVLGVEVARQNFDAKNDPKEAKYLAAYSDCKNVKDVNAAKEKLLKANPSDKAAAEKFAELRLRELSIQAANELATNPDRGLSEIAGETLLKFKWSVTSESIRKQMGHTMKSEEKLAELERAAPSEPGRKPFESMSDDEIKKLVESFDSKAGKTDDDRRLARALTEYSASRTPARREYVAISGDISYEEVARREANGESLDSMFEKARKEPVFKNAAPNADANRKESASTTDGDGTYGPASGPRSLKEGQSYEFKFAGDSAPVEVKKTSDTQNPFLVSVGGKESFACSEKNLRAHLDMVKLLCDNGLEFLAPVSKEMLKTVSVRDGNLATAEDGNFSDREKRLLLKGFANAFEIDWFPTDSVEVSWMEAYLKTFAAERSTTFRDLGMRSKILDENGNVRNREAFFARLGK